MATPNNSIIPVTSHILSGVQEQCVDARHLHTFLEVGRDFTTWIKDRIAEYGFVVEQDFSVCSPNSGSKKRGGVNRVDYILTLAMAKELAMVEKNEKGREARRYFLECERLAKEALMKQAQPQTPKLLPDQTQKHYWLTLNSSGNVLSQVELKDPTVVSDKVDEVFPEVAVLNRQTVMADMEAMMSYAYEMTTKLNKRMSGLLSVLGTPANATENEIKKFWKDELHKSSDRLAKVAGH